MLLSLFVYSCLLLTAFDATSINTTSSTNFLSNIIGSFFRGPDPINITRFLSTFQLPACMRECVPEIDGLLMALSRSNDSSDFVEICSELQSSTSCASSSGCSTIFTDAATSAFQFVCLDNIQAISESIKCVKNTAIEVQPDCEAHCAVDSANLNISSSNSLETFFDVPTVCNSTRCLLTCFKNKIGDKCRLGQRNLLDSLLSAVIHDNDDGDSLLDRILPDSCQPKNAPKIFGSLSTNTPLSVGQVVRRPITDNKHEDTKTTSNEFQRLIDLPSKNAVGKNTGSLEAVLLVDGKIRTLRYQMFDWQGNPVPPPDLQTLSKILLTQPLSLTFSPERPGETVVLPSEEEEDNETRNRQIGNLLEEQGKEENIVQRRSLKKDDEKSGTKKRHSKDKNDAIRNNSNVVNETVCISVRIAIFSTTVLLWISKILQDIY